jgi:hypothetical protein
MKLLVAIVLTTVLVSSSVVAQHGSPINIAHQLYDGCMGGYVLAANIRPTRSDIKNYIDSSHEQCLTWMVVWYKPVTGHVMRITEWDDQELDKLDAMIKRTDYMMNIELRAMLGVK